MNRLVLCISVLAGSLLAASPTAASAQTPTHTGHSAQHPHAARDWYVSCSSEAECDELQRFHYLRCHRQTPPDMAWCTGIGSRGAQGAMRLTPLTVGLALTAGGAGFGAALGAASQASKPQEQQQADAEQGKSDVVTGAAYGAVAGATVAAVVIGVTAIAKWRPAPRGAPWWQRGRLVGGADRRGVPRIGLQW